MSLNKRALNWQAIRDCVIFTRRMASRDHGLKHKMHIWILSYQENFAKKKIVWEYSSTIASNFKTYLQKFDIFEVLKLSGLAKRWETISLLTGTYQQIEQIC